MNTALISVPNLWLLNVMAAPGCWAAISPVFMSTNWLSKSEFSVETRFRRTEMVTYYALLGTGPLNALLMISKCLIGFHAYILKIIIPCLCGAAQRVIGWYAPFVYPWPLGCFTGTENYEPVMYLQYKASPNHNKTRNVCMVPVCTVTIATTSELRYFILPIGLNDHHSILLDYMGCFC